MTDFNSQTLYRTLWRWHFYAGIFCIPFVVILSITGSIYLFKPYYEHWQERDIRGLTSVGQRRLPNEQIRAALAAVEKGKLLSYRLPQAMDEAVLIKVQGQQTWNVYVNPYTLAVLKAQRLDRTLMQRIRTLHGELLLGNVGSIVVELAACWAIVLIVTGLYLWWPRNARGVSGILLPRITQGARLFWRDLHAVTGIWISVCALFLLISGLPWALVWGASLQELRALASPRIQQDWSQSRAQEHSHHGARASAAFNLTSAILQRAENLSLAPPVELSPENFDSNHSLESGQWKVASQAQNRTLREEVWVNSSGDIERRSAFADKARLDRIIGLGITVHEGSLFGRVNVLVGLMTCVGLVLVSISGFVLWRKRKPYAVLGAPPPMPAQWNGWVVSILLLLVLFLPLMAISLAFIWMSERLVLRRLLATRRWLGLPSL